LELWLADADALFLRRDRAELLVVLPWQTWARLVPGMVRPGRIATAANAENRLLAQSAADVPRAPSRRQTAHQRPSKGARMPMRLTP
jgi:hypothetical protein